MNDTMYAVYYYHTATRWSLQRHRTWWGCRAEKWRPSLIWIGPKSVRQVSWKNLKWGHCPYIVINNMSPWLPDDLDLCLSLQEVSYWRWQQMVHPWLWMIHCFQCVILSQMEHQVYHSMGMTWPWPSIWPMMETPSTVSSVVIK